MLAKNRSTIPEWLKWLTLISIIAASVAIIIGAVNLSPSSAQAGQVESEVLAKQLEFILKMNSAFLGFLGITGALLTWFFKNNLEDAKKVAREIVRQELHEHIEPLIQEEVQYLERTLQVEQIVGRTSVCYYLASNGEDKPIEYNLLEARGFNIHFWNKGRQPRRRLGDVLVLDISNSPENIAYLESENESEQQKQLFTELEELVGVTLNDLLDRSLKGRVPVIVIYVRPGRKRIQSIDNLKTEFPKIKYYTSANTPVALMGWVVDSAYVADGDRVANS